MPFDRLRSAVQCALVAFVLFAPLMVRAADTLRIGTVDRPPFSMELDGERTGYSIELMNLLAMREGASVQYILFDSFPDMLDAVAEQSVDGAIANISITAEREQRMDFSQPIFSSGLQIMIPDESLGGGIIAAVLTPQLAMIIVAAFAVLLAIGFLMWVFERNRQPYFDRPSRQALFPSFWWALNLVVNGGFEERMPQSFPGRIFAVLLVISSLFVVSIFVAHITAAITVNAITNSVQSLNDLSRRDVVTTEGSTASALLEQRGIKHARAADMTTMIAEFEAGQHDAVFFDGPILAWYAKSSGDDKVTLVEKVFQPESYGIALPTGSPLREYINRSLLTMAENGELESLRARWVGAN